MRKTAVLIAIMAICSSPALAAKEPGFVGQKTTAGGFVGPSSQVTTVEQAKAMRDDTWVTLRGNIVQRLSDDLYQFRDASGTINVDIDHKHWNGLTVQPQDLVELHGEVDKDWNSIDIDVKQVIKIQ